MTIQESIRRLAASRAEIYCKVCKVDAIDEGARTVDVSPLDESAPILGVNLQADQSAEVGVVAFPKQGSHVVVAFLADAAAVVVLTSEVDKVHVKLGENDPFEVTASDGRVLLNVGKTSLDIAKNKAISLNGGDNGGLVVIQKLTDKINELVDKFNNHTHLLATKSVQVEGTPSKQMNLAPITVPAINAKAQKLKKGDYENTNIKH